MLVYRDRTFCVCKDCIVRKCNSKLTKEVEERAAALGLPVSLGDLSKICRLYSCTSGQSQNNIL